MDIKSAFPSTYLKAADLQGKTAKVTIKDVKLEVLGSGVKAETKPILYFEGKSKGLVLNKTNSNTISMLYGSETEDWVGREIELFSVMTEYQGGPVEGLRVRSPRPASRTTQRQPEPPPPPPQTYQSLRDEIDDEIPF